MRRKPLHTTRSQCKGFTLVELLVVVAIIGVLASIGIPTFTRMLQRSRQVEAKTLLGNIYAVEKGFYAEWGVYGNRLSKMGIDDVPEQTRYIVGTYVTNCGKPIGDIPQAWSGPGIELAKMHPDYYIPEYNAATLSDFAIGRLTFTACGNASFVSIDGASFNIEATGVIAPGINLDNPAGGNADADIWSINHNGVLSNVQSGIR